MSSESYALRPTLRQPAVAVSRLESKPRHLRFPFRRLNMRSKAWIRVSLLLLCASLAPAQPVALSVNNASREEVRQFYRALFHASENVSMGWTGNYSTGNAGDTNATFKEATRLRINFYRALAGVPADIAFNSTYSAKAQAAALLMSVNDTLSHTPPPTWTLYTAVAAEGALNSNLALGQAGPDAISGYVADAGDNNAFVGHRRWLLYPQTLRMGTGDVPGIPDDPRRRAANAVWVIDTTPGGRFGDPRPATRTTAVPYPPAGFVPYQLVWPRWSFSYPGADFAGTTVTMTRRGQTVAAAPEALGANIGEPTLVWIYDRQNPDLATPHARPVGDTTYTVNVNNVRIGGAAQNFTYDVTVFDPDVPGFDATPVAITGAAFPTVGTANSYVVTKPAFTTSFEWRSVQLASTTRTFTAESGLEDLIAATSPGYDVIQTTTVATGTRAYRLTHVSLRSDQSLRIPGTYLVTGADSGLTFRSRLGIATETELARVQVSTDDGVSWADVFSQAGTSPTNTNMPPPTETAFVTRSIPLANLAGRTIAVRLVFSVGSGITFVPEPDNAVGWFIDDLTLTNVQALTPGTPRRVTSGNTFSFTPTTPGPVGLQARGVMFGAYPLEWGTISPVNVVSSDGSTTNASYLSNLSVRTNAGAGAQTLIVGFAVSGGTKPLLVRGIGPTLSSFGVPGALDDPRLELYRDSAKIAENDNWLSSDAVIFGRVGAFTLGESSRDSALTIQLAPGSYTAQVNGAAGTTGVALVELYDTAGLAAGAKLTNVSARSEIGPGNETLIAGFNISGSGDRTLLIRAVGPTLGAFGVQGALSDPKLELFGGGAKIQENDNWDEGTSALFSRIGAFDLTAGSRDAVLLVTLPPGSYTAQVSGVAGASGVTLVEVYEVP